MELKKGTDVEELQGIVDNEGFWYAITDGGWIEPEKVLHPIDARKVVEAIRIVRKFEALIPPL